MLIQKQPVEIKVLARQGMGIKTVVRTLGLSRNTVRRFLRGKAKQPSYPARPPRPAKLHPFKAHLQERTHAAQPYWIPATVLFREIQAQGYAGSASSLKSWLAPFRRPVHDPVVRFETLPGQ